jgi:hypothetical protein
VSDTIGRKMSPVLDVTCGSWREFAELYANDIASGGMYVPHAAPQPLLSSIDVRLRLPEATEIVFAARVVQVLSVAHAEELGKTPGIALELIDLDDDRKRQIVHLVEFARWQGATDDPHTSFARTLLELSPALPPRELVSALSRAPAAAAGALGETREVRPRPQSGPLRSPPARGSSQQIAAAVQGDSKRATSSTPAKADLAAQPARASLPAPRARRDSQVTQPLDLGAIAAASLAPPAAKGGTAPPSATDAPSVPTAPITPPKPTDQRLLKVVLTSVAHKRYDEGVRATQEMLAANPGDPQALRWQATCQARLAIARNEPAVACKHYEQLLSIDAENREAREFVRTHTRDQKLNSLPFGRYFTKKK